MKKLIILLFLIVSIAGTFSYINTSLLHIGLSPVKKTLPPADSLKSSRDCGYQLPDHYTFLYNAKTDRYVVLRLKGSAPYSRLNYQRILSGDFKQYLSVDPAGNYRTFNGSISGAETFSDTCTAKQIVKDMVEELHKRAIDDSLRRIRDSVEAVQDSINNDFYPLHA
jgi:hypothetical protein